MGRIELTKPALESTVARVRAKMERRLCEKGRGSFVSAHESLGIILEEVHELQHAVEANDYRLVERECVDIAVACILAITSSAVGYSEHIGVDR